MKNKIFLSITMLVSMSSHASQTPMQEAPLLLMADQFKKVAMEFIFKLYANPEVQEKLKQIFAGIKDDIYHLAEKSQNAKALRQDFDDLLDSLKESAFIDKIKEDSKALVVEVANELKPEFKAVMEELKKLYPAKDYPKAGNAGRVASSGYGYGSSK